MDVMTLKGGIAQEIKEKKNGTECHETKIWK